MRAKRYFVAASSVDETACEHEHTRLGEAFDCGRERGLDEAWRVEIRPAGPVPVAKAKIRRRKRATRRVP